jgi:hypothetical protein
VTTDQVTDFVAALDACHEQASPGGAVCARTGWTVASARRVSGDPVPGSAGLLRASRGTGGPRPEALAAFSSALVRLHWRTLRTAFDATVVRLGSRTSEGTDLLSRQLVQGAVADAALALNDCAGLLGLPDESGPPGPPGAAADAGERRLWQARTTLVRAGRATLKLSGAAGFLAAGPGSVIYLAELLGNVYLRPGRVDHG